VRRLVAASIALVALALGACETNSDDGAVYSGYSDGCRQFTTCGTCTPVLGCGWCFDSDGTGICAADPDECVTPVFSWTWNPSGCRVPATVGAGQADAGAVPVPTDDAAPADDATPAEDATPAGDAAPATGNTVGATGDAAPSGDASSD
jgi:hypothetical protein